MVFILYLEKQSIFNMLKKKIKEKLFIKENCLILLTIINNKNIFENDVIQLGMILINVIMQFAVEHCVDLKVFAVLLGNSDEDIFGESFFSRDANWHLINDSPVGLQSNFYMVQLLNFHGRVSVFHRLLEIKETFEFCVWIS